MSGTEVHVAADADANAADGTERHPFATIEEAVTTLATNEQWTGTLVVHEGTYEIMDDVVLPIGVKLQVDAGTTMKFDELKAFHAQADVKMIGTETKPILMTTLTEGKFWGSFTNYEPTSQDNVFKYVTFGALFGPDIIYNPTHLWRLVTPIFVHIGWEHFLLNFFTLIFIGRQIEGIFGSQRFFAIYLFSGIYGNITSFFFEPYSLAAGASTSLFGIFSAMAMLGYLTKNPSFQVVGKQFTI
ncbi:MAG TPA: rhomboid family intramembrane serine protease, partial [Polyangiaceae bacterium]